jgi:hypothetical protein
VAGDLSRITGGFLVIVALSLSPGCSFVFVKGPPADQRGPQVECTTGPAWPIVDTALSAGSAVVGMREIMRKDVDAYAEGFRRLGVGLAIVGALAWAGSAYYGFTRTADCREARAAHPGSGG